jgi:eukaryotic-like serine/threonine-protein kinase
MSRPENDRNLLFGINAVQNDFITRDDLIDAMNAWVLEKHRPLGEILVKRGALSPADWALLDQLIDRHIAKHDGDPARSLAAISSIADLANALRQSIADPEIHASIAHVSTESQHDPHGTRPPDTTDYVPAAIRYRKVRDHAKGGLGIVFVALDGELKREVALKEIKPEFADNLASQSRFLREAEITGALEHPGIVPVYGLGAYDDGRPFYAMRFIKGDSLKDAITAFHADTTLTRDPGARALALQKLLRRFLDVCNAIDYAHSRGVLHRDLKPDNVMVGRYGETLVVDWGLAKSVGRSGEDGYGPLPESTLPYSSSSNLAETLPGSVIGTPAYMSPEQAAGRLDLLGPASDVYGLGATLYTLLTGRLPIADKDLSEILRKVERGEFPRPREASPWLDTALEAITLKAMALRPLDRYPSPRTLADDVERWLADEPVTAHREPWARKARRWARKHRTAVTTTAAAVAVAAILLGGFGWQRIEQRRRTDESALSAMGQAEGLAIGARASHKPEDWEKTLAEARLAKDRLESGNGSPTLRREVTARLAGFQAEKSRLDEAIETDRKDHQVVDDLEKARLLGANVKDGHFDSDARLNAYLDTFRDYGIDVGALPVEEAAKRIRSSKVGNELLSALDDWLRYGTRNVPQKKLLEIAQASDTDQLRNSIREAFARRDFAAIRRLCEREEDRLRLGSRVRSVFDALRRLDPAGSFPLLEAIRNENPSEFWLNHDLGWAYYNAKPPQFPEALRYLTVAVALRPKSQGVRLNLGIALAAKGDRDGAIAEFRKAIELEPKYAMAHVELGDALAAKGDRDGADVEYRKVIELNSKVAMVHHNLSLSLNAKGDRDGAIVELRKTIELEPKYTTAHYNLGLALFTQGDLDGAIAEFRKTIELDPSYATAHGGLGLALNAKGDRDGAIAEYRKSIELEPNLAISHFNLGRILLNVKGDLDGAIAEFRKAIEADPKDAPVHSNLGIALNAKGDPDGAIAEFRKAIELNPEYSPARENLGIALDAKGDHDGAIAECRKAIEIDPKSASALCNLGNILKSQGLLAESLVYLEKGHELGSRQPGWRNPSARWLSDCRRLVELEPKLPAILKGEVSPKDTDERIVLTELCRIKTLHAASARFYGQAFADQPPLAENLRTGHRYNAACAAALAGSGTGKDDPPPDEAGRGKLREQALGWLRADLAAWAKVLDGGNEPARKRAVIQTLAHWKQDTDLAGIRDEAALAKLPESEREAFRSLWAEVDRLLAKAR